MKDTRKIGVIHITLYNFIAKVVFFIFLFFVSFYASRHLTDQQFGIAQYVTWTVNFSWLIFNFGGASTLQRFIASAFMQHQKSAVRKYLVFGMCSAVLSIVTGLLAWFVYKAYNPLVQQFPGTFLFLVFHFAVSYMQVVAQSFFKYKAIFYINIISAIAGVSFLLLTIDAYKGAAYIWMYLLINIIQFICYAVILTQSYYALTDTATEQIEDPVSYMVLIKTAAYFGGSAILAALLWQRPELYLVKRFLGFDKVAVYSVALNIISLMLEPLKMLSGAMLSYFAGISHLKDKVEEQFFTFFKHYTWLAIFVGVFLWFEAHTIVTFIYTQTYAESARLVQIMLLGFIPGVCTYLIMHLLVGLKRTTYLITQDIIIAVLFIIAAVVGLKYVSLFYISMAKAGLFFISFGMAVLYVIFRLKFKFPIKSMVKSLSLSILLFWLLGFIPGNTIWHTIERLMLAALLYTGISFKIQLIDSIIVEKVGLELKKILKIVER
jgi:teichuronic acid exporter